MSKWLSKLQKLEGYVNPAEIPQETGLRTPSPSMNWAFGTKSRGLPLGHTMLLGGPAKSGKTFISLNMVKQLHQDDANGIAIMFNTEFRGKAQANEQTLSKLGVDKDRFIVYETNTPDGIFDRIVHDINAMCQDGMPLRLIIIDSISGIQGRRKMNADSVMQQQIGDEAATIQDGLKMILPIIRKHNIALILCTHVRDEMDQHEVMRGNKQRLQAANATKHFAEFFCFVERNRTKTGKTSLGGEEFLDESSKDFMGKGEVTGHKVRFKVMDSSLGVNNRSAEFTLDFERGIINQYEEVFQLGLNTGVITKPNNVMYEFDGSQWRGLGSALEAIKQDAALQKKILDKVYELDDFTTQKGEEK